MKDFFKKMLGKIYYGICAIIGYSIPILIVWDLFGAISDRGSFIFRCLGVIWNAIGSVVMFFVGILNKIVSFFRFLGDGIVWVLSKVGVLLNPLLEVIPDSPIIPFILFLILGTLFLMLKRPNTTPNVTIFDRFMKLSYGWCCAAVNLGIVIAGSSNPKIWMSGAFDGYTIDTPMTLFNIAEWSGYARTMLILTLIGGGILSLIYAIEKDPLYITRSWVGLAFCCTLGYQYMNLRLAITYWLAKNLGFIGRLLNIPIGLLEFFLLIQVYLGIVVFLLPLDGLKATTDTVQAIDSISNKSGNSGKKEAAVTPSDNFPTYVSDDEGNHYQVRRDGDFLYIILPHGEISIEWDDVKGHSYFYVKGKRFYPHT